MTEGIPPITTKTYGITDQPEVEINKLAVMVEAWVDEKLNAYTIEVDSKLEGLTTNVQQVIKDFYDGVLKYFKSGLIVSINVGLIGFGWFLNNILS